MLFALWSISFFSTLYKLQCFYRRHIKKYFWAEITARKARSLDVHTRKMPLGSTVITPGDVRTKEMASTPFWKEAGRWKISLEIGESVQDCWRQRPPFYNSRREKREERVVRAQTVDTVSSTLCFISSSSSSASLLLLLELRKQGAEEAAMVLAMDKIHGWSLDAQCLASMWLRGIQGKSHKERLEFFYGPQAHACE